MGVNVLTLNKYMIMKEIAGSTWPPQQHIHKTSEYLTYGFVDDFRQQGKLTADLKNSHLATPVFKKRINTPHWN